MEELWTADTAARCIGNYWCCQGTWQWALGQRKPKAESKNWTPVMNYLQPRPLWWTCLRHQWASDQWLYWTLMYNYCWRRSLTPQLPWQHQRGSYSLRVLRLCRQMSWTFRSSQLPRWSSSLKSASCGVSNGRHSSWSSWQTYCRQPNSQPWFTSNTESSGS